MKFDYRIGDCRELLKTVPDMVWTYLESGTLSAV